MDWSPIWISMKTATLSIIITFFLGVWMARLVVSARSEKVKMVLDGILTLPMVLPPTVAGFFLLMIFLYKNYGKKLHRGFFFGLCLAYIFTFRFFIEFVKQNQEAFEDNMMFNMGQWLSVPFIIIGFYFMFFYDRKKVAKK